MGRHSNASEGRAQYLTKAHQGYGFVRFSKREYANIAKRQKNGVELQGKRLVVDLSMDQDTVFFGNLCKEWTSEEFEELIHKTFKDVVSVDLAMASNLGSSSKKHINRGFGFVRFSSHSVSLSSFENGSYFFVSSFFGENVNQLDFMLGGVLHPAINWADKESHVDDDEMAKIKTAFVGNLPENVNDEYLRKLFEQFGEVIRVAISRKGQRPVGFVHFASRSVSVARPAVDNEKKRSREEVRTRRSDVSGDRPDYSYRRQGHDSHDRQVKAPRSSNYVSIYLVLARALVLVSLKLMGVLWQMPLTPIESALASLPSAAKEILLRILRLGIGTQYDIDIHSVKSLNELPESSAVAVLNKHQVETFGLAHTLHGATYLPRNSEMHVKQYPHEEYDYMAPGSSRYNSGHHPSSYYIDDPPESQSRIRRYGEERSTILRNPEPRHDEIDTKRYPEPRLAHESRHNTGKYLDRGYIPEQSLSIERSPEEAGLSRGRRFLLAGGYGTDLGSDFCSRSPAEYSAERQQVRFDPFTGEPYKFDPFTGEPIRPEPNHRRSGSLY
ncbi:hypothetical protein HU200_052703 [Digitaria exilis]|uniref:RRM domain-containing protein n=1 Tax=Digitaria exilis TaxID=1010633 RepID=A0A835ANC8_9POAL|nr:hypothetical protein HU200_052703 [Digitaria exilis]